MRIVPTIRGEGDWEADDLRATLDKVMTDFYGLFERLLQVEVEIIVERELEERKTQPTIVEQWFGEMHTRYDLRVLVAPRVHFGMLDVGDD